MNATQALEVVSQSPLFLGLSGEEKEKIAAVAEPLTFEDEETVVCEGGRCDALFLVASGTVEVVRGYRTDREILVTALSAEEAEGGYEGNFFGEMCLIDVEPRSATVIARGPVMVVRIGVGPLWQLCERHPEIQVVILTNLARTLARRLRETTERWAV